MEVCWDDKTKTWSMRPLTIRKQKFSLPNVMKMRMVLAVLALIAIGWFATSRSRVSSPVCPRGYYFVTGPNSFAGNPRQCIPIGETSSEDAIPAVNYTPVLDWSVMI